LRVGAGGKCYAHGGMKASARRAREETTRAAMGLAALRAGWKQVEDE